GHREKRAGSIACFLIEVSGAGKIKTLSHIGVGNVDGFTGKCSIGSDHLIVWLVFLVVQMHWIERNGITGSSSHSDIQGYIPHDREPKSHPLLPKVKSAAVRARYCLRGKKYLLEQRIQIAF